MVLIRPLLGNETLDDDPEAVPVPATFGLDEIEEKICSCHGPCLLMPRRALAGCQLLSRLPAFGLKPAF